MSYALTVVVLFSFFLVWRDLCTRLKLADVKAPPAVDLKTDVLDEDANWYLKAFREYRQADPWAARLVMRNALGKFADDQKIFTVYMDYLLEEAAENKVLEYLEEAKDILVAFAEYSPLEFFPQIIAYRDKVNGLQEAFYNEAETLRAETNDEVLAELEDILDLLKEPNSEPENGRSLLVEAVKVEENLAAGFLSADQLNRYERLQAEFAEVAESLDNILQLKRYRQYNLEVIQRIKEIFDNYKAGQRLFAKDRPDVLALMKNLATVNTQYLTAETLTYFNHVYGYIFSEISQDDKFAVTELMTKSEKDVVIA